MFVSVKISEEIETLVLCFILAYFDEGQCYFYLIAEMTGVIDKAK